MLERLKTSSNFAEQGRLAAALGIAGGADVLLPLIKIVDDKSLPSRTRAMAIVCLGLLGDPRDVPALARVARDYNYRASVHDLDELLYLF